MKWVTRRRHCLIWFQRFVPPCLRMPRKGGPGRIGIDGSPKSWRISGQSPGWAAASTVGLMGVVSLPRPFVFRVNQDDPHPMPWVRVMLSAAIGSALYPHPQWKRVAELWESYYPLTSLDQSTARVIQMLREGIPEFVKFLIDFQPRRLRGYSLSQAMNLRERQPERLAELKREWDRKPAQLYEAPPSLVLAVLGQARFTSHLTPEDESVLIAKLLTYWALKTALDTSTYCAHRQNRRTRLRSFRLAGEFQSSQTRMAV